MASMPRPLPDYLRPDLDVVFVGANPSVVSSKTGRYYANPGNHFWPLLYQARLVPELLAPQDDERVLDHGIGLTDLVKRPSRGIADLSRAEMEAGVPRLREKLRYFRPRVICFNGKRIYEIYSGGKCEYGLQEEHVGGGLIYVMPSTSARAAAYPKAKKLRFFRELKRLVDRQASS